MFTALLLTMMHLVLLAPAAETEGAARETHKTTEAQMDKLDAVLQKMVTRAGEEGSAPAEPVRVIIKTRKAEQDALASKLEDMDVRIVKRSTVLPLFIVEATIDEIVDLTGQPEVVGISADAGVSP